MPTWVCRVVWDALHRLRQLPTTRVTPEPGGTATMTITNRSRLPAVALEIGSALSALGARGGLVTVNGTWGSGKTTIIRAALQALGETPTVTYDPWLWR